MENCKVTKIKGVAQNENLPAFREITVKLLTDNNGWVWIAADKSGVFLDVLSEGVTLTEVGDGTTKIISPTRASLGTTGYHTCLLRFSVSNSSVIIKISDKYHIAELRDVQELSATPYYMTALGGIKLRGEYAGVLFGMSDLKYNTEIQELELAAQNVNLVTGDIKDLGTLTQLKLLVFRSDSLVEGTIESFVQAQRSSGRTTESTGITFFGAQYVTFNGVTTGGTNGTITWTASTITYNGVTVDA